MKKLRIPSNFFIRMLMISCIIGIIPLLLLGYLSYHQSSSMVQEEAYKGNLLVLQQNRAKVEYLLKTADALTTQMINAPITTNAVSTDTVLQLPYVFEHRKLFQHLIHRLVQIQVFELGIRDVNLISFSQNWLVDKGTLHDLNSFSGELRQERDILKLNEELHQYRTALDSSFWTLVQSEDGEDRFVLKLIKTIPIHSTNPTGIVSVNIPLREISNRLTRDERLGTVFIVGAEGRIISHPDPDWVGREIADQSFYLKMQRYKDSGGYYLHAFTDKDYAVIYDRSPYNNWTYVSVTPIDMITANSRAIKWYTFFVSLFIVLLVIAISFLASRRMYSPIRNLYRFITSTAPIQDHRGDELHYIGERVRGMVKTQDRMAGQIQGLNRQAREYFVMKLLQGKLKPGEIDENLEKYGFSGSWDQWCIISVQIDSLEDTRYSENDWDLLMFAIHNMVEEIVPPESRLSPVMINQSLHTLIGMVTDRNKPFKVAIYAFAEEIQQKIRQFLGLKVSIGISRAYESLVHTYLAYQESLDALTYRIRLGQEAILFMDEVQPEKAGRFRYPKESERVLLHYVKQADLPQAKAELSRIIHELKDTHINHYDYKMFLGRLVNSLVTIIHDEGESAHDVFGKNVLRLDKLWTLNSATEIIGWFEREILGPVMTKLDEQRKSREIHISEEILGMIREDYDKDLTIESCAARLNFNPNYLSRVFKKEMGVTFSDYLAEYRVNIAKGWLRDTDMKISEIAERLRYSNSSNFNRKFRQLVKMTPTQYREKGGE